MSIYRIILDAYKKSLRFYVHQRSRLGANDFLDAISRRLNSLNSSVLTYSAFPPRESSSAVQERPIILRALFLRHATTLGEIVARTAIIFLRRLAAMNVGCERRIVLTSLLTHRLLVLVLAVDNRKLLWLLLSRLHARGAGADLRDIYVQLEGGRHHDLRSSAVQYLSLALQSLEGRCLGVVVLQDRLSLSVSGNVEEFLQLIHVRHVNPQVGVNGDYLFDYHGQTLVSSLLGPSCIDSWIWATASPLSAAAILRSFFLPSMWLYLHIECPDASWGLCRGRVANVQMKGLRELLEPTLSVKVSQDCEMTIHKRKSASLGSRSSPASRHAERPCSNGQSRSKSTKQFKFAPDFFPPLHYTRTAKDSDAPSMSTRSRAWSKIDAPGAFTSPSRVYCLHFYTPFGGYQGRIVHDDPFKHQVSQLPFSHKHIRAYKGFWSSPWPSRKAHTVFASLSRVSCLWSSYGERSRSEAYIFFAVVSHTHFGLSRASGLLDGHGVDRAAQEERERSCKAGSFFTVFASPSHGHSPRVVSWRAWRTFGLHISLAVESVAEVRDRRKAATIRLTILAAKVYPLGSIKLGGHRFRNHNISPNPAHGPASGSLAHERMAYTHSLDCGGYIDLAPRPTRRRPRQREGVARTEVFTTLSTPRATEEATRYNGLTTVLFDKIHVLPYPFVRNAVQSHCRLRNTAHSNASLLLLSTSIPSKLHSNRLSFHRKTPTTIQRSSNSTHHPQRSPNTPLPPTTTAMASQDPRPHISYRTIPDFRTHLIAMINEVSTKELKISTWLFQIPETNLSALKSAREDLESAVKTRVELTEAAVAYDLQNIPPAQEKVLNEAAWAIKIGTIHGWDKGPRRPPKAYFTKGTWMEVREGWSLRSFKTEREGKGKGKAKEGGREEASSLYDGSSWGAQSGPPQLEDDQEDLGPKALVPRITITPAGDADGKRILLLISSASLMIEMER
ncbi:uncharacterized protein MYCFIDRAFT_177598 [Pseudocercospora fijiensis CIRAD86]|uniref:Uncharacterized protein n=1 Tax=Pseudocercospora fijiensis (strain CIRAD86) TaxID=383855 RepID=M3AT57_PSEFD|nr:uncharacterized protein MYCFIDRAFT_177598 [Pseudocercospora fijiensis CIRAD86]EME80667.1 hypothetical protein MYCFIDRAFT_177598 [Pseudocercospora fijiensis CIRAD86]